MKERWHSLIQRNVFPVESVKRCVRFLQSVCRIKSQLQIRKNAWAAGYAVRVVREKQSTEFSA